MKTELDVLRGLMLAFIGWCEFNHGLPAPTTPEELSSLVLRFPLIKRSGWWPVPNEQYDTPKREEILSLIDSWIEPRPLITRDELFDI